MVKMAQGETSVMNGASLNNVGRRSAVPYNTDGGWRSSFAFARKGQPQIVAIEFGEVEAAVTAPASQQTYSESSN
jgi:hypothetical protein